MPIKLEIVDSAGNPVMMAAYTGGVSTISADVGISVDNSDPHNPLVGNTGVLSLTELSGTSGISLSGSLGDVIIGNTGVRSLSAGVGISAGAATGAVSIINTGVLSISAGTGLSAGAATGALSLVNTGVVSLAESTGISISAVTGAITIEATGGVVKSGGFTNSQIIIADGSDGLGMMMQPGANIGYPSITGATLGDSTGGSVGAGLLGCTGTDGVSVSAIHGNFASLGNQINAIVADLAALKNASTATIALLATKKIMANPS